MTRIPGLDGVRGIAILMVVASHAHPPSYAVGGIAGVTLFFVLSGFLITRLLIDETNLRRFYVRRAFRLFPPLIVFFCVIGVSVGWDRVWFAAIYVSNYAQILGADVEPLRHMWSLAVEEHFYMLWPIILMTFPAARKPWVLMIAVASSAAWRLVVPSGFYAYQATDTNAYALALGCLLVFVIDSWRPSSWIFYSALGGLLAIGTYLPVSFTSSGRWIGILAATLSVLVIWGAASQSIPLLSLSPLRLAGQVSYAWYLWHVPFIAWAVASGPMLLPVAVAGSLVVSIVSWHLVERPVLRMRERIVPSPAPAAVPLALGKQP